MTVIALVLNLSGTGGHSGADKTSIAQHSHHSALQVSLPDIPQNGEDEVFGAACAALCTGPLLTGIDAALNGPVTFRVTDRTEGPRRWTDWRHLSLPPPKAA